VAVDLKGTEDVLVKAARHKGASVVEVLQNCVIFNNGTHDSLATSDLRAKNAIYLEHGKPMIFGENRELGLMQEGFGLKVVKIGENGITEKDLLVHDAHCMDNTLQLKLALMEGPDFPVALGVIRDVDAPTYNDAVYAQVEEVSTKKNYHNFAELLETNETWEIK
jgi:2-oxoglutarate ferredoxin oxidoreductase subunit beta